MSLTLGIALEDYDRILDERAKRPDADADAERWWLLCRKLHLSKKFETDDGKADADAFTKALCEVMARDLGNEDALDLSRHDAGYLKADREQERRLARKQIFKLNSQKIKGLLKTEFGGFHNLLASEFTYHDLMDADDFVDIARVMARATYRTQKFYKDLNVKDKRDHLLSLQRLVLDLGRAIAHCDSIEAYLSVNNLFIWSAREISDLTFHLGPSRAAGLEFLKACVKLIVRNYVVSVLLVELKAKTLNPGLPKLEQGIPSEDLDKLLKDCLGFADTVFSSTRPIKLFLDPTSYVTDGRVDFGEFAEAIAKVMVIDKTNVVPLPAPRDGQKRDSDREYAIRQNAPGPLPPLREILDFESDYLIRTNVIRQRIGVIVSRRRNQQQEGAYDILTRSETDFVERLIGDGWMRSITDSAKIVSDDLLSPNAMKELTEKLAVVMRDELKEGIRTVDRKPQEGEVHTRLTEVRPFIIDLGGSLNHWNDFHTYLRVCLYLFWATADAWWSLPASDSCQTAKKSKRGIAEKFLRSYLALVLIDEYQI